MKHIISVPDSTMTMFNEYCKIHQKSPQHTVLEAIRFAVYKDFLGSIVEPSVGKKKKSPRENLVSLEPAESDTTPE